MAGPKWLMAFVLLAFISAAGSLRAEGPDDDYLEIFSLIERADLMAQNGQTNQARLRYQQAQTGLVNFRRKYPSWNMRAVSYRLSYLAGKVAALTPPLVPPAEPSPEARSSTPPSGSGTTVRLLEPGSEPRTALRYQVPSGGQQGLALTLTMAMGIGVGDMPATPIKVPPIRIGATVQTGEVTPDGQIHYQMAFDEVEVMEEPGSMPEMVTAMKDSMEHFKGVQVISAMSDRGLSKEPEIKMPPGAAPQMREAMQQMKSSFSSGQLVLPEEPVGPGARWEVKQKLKSQGIAIDQTSTYTLVSVEGNMLVARSSIVQQAGRQRIANPAMPQVQVDLNKLSGTGSADMTVDLTRIVPSRAAIDNHIEMMMGAQGQTMSMNMDMNIQVEAK